MTQRLHQLLDRVVFAYDFERVFSRNGVKYMYDHGPHGFHMQFPGGGADPTEQLDGSYYFDGGDYLILPASELARFYAKMPTREHTWIFGYRAPALGGFFGWDTGVAPRRGLTARISSTTAVQVYQNQGLPTPSAIQFTGAQLGPTCWIVASVEASARVTLNGIAVSAPWVAGSFGVCENDATVAPRLGYSASGGYMRGSIIYVALVSGAVDLPTQLEIQRWLAVGRKPWCEGVFG